MAMGRADLIGNGKQHLIPSFQPLTAGGYSSARRKNSTPQAAKPAAPKAGRLLTQHTGLPPRELGAGVRHKTAAMAPRRKART
jgi:hypothetical protein